MHCNTSYGDDMKLIAELMMGEQALTCATDANPVLATAGLASCVALVGYESTKKLGFMTHYTSRTNVDESFADLLCSFYQVGLDHDESRFGVSIFGGKSDANLNAYLRDLIVSGNPFAMHLDNEVNSDEVRTVSVALDTRSGKMFSYDPLRNPWRREFSENDLHELGERKAAVMIHVPNWKDE